MRFPLVLVVVSVLLAGCGDGVECECKLDGSCNTQKILDGPPDHVAAEDWRPEAEAPYPDLSFEDLHSQELWPEVAPSDLPDCEEGTVCNPIVIPGLPYIDERDGTDAPSDEFDFYTPCAPDVNESGPEFLYVLEVPEAGVLSVSLDESVGDNVDMDVHILSALSADSCLARAHWGVSHYVEPGTYYISVDTWVDEAGTEYPGPYRLDVHMSGGSLLPEQAGFNKYIVDAINDLAKYPKDSTYPFCYSDPSCEPDWVDVYFGMVHDTYYLGEMLFEGTQRCYCCGHTLEIFLDAYRRYQLENGVAEDQPYGGMTLDEVDIGPFYQHWYGWGVAQYSSSANALEVVGIGLNIYEQDWESAVTGDMTNISRNNGTGHAVIFVNWVYEDGQIAGIRYYGCNGSADSHPDPNDPDNVSGVSGPSYATEYFTTHGGKVLKNYVFVGRAFDPNEL